MYTMIDKIDPGMRTGVFNELIDGIIETAQSPERGNMKPPPFVGFPKIPRWNRDVVITEKIDGTNASILITEEGGFFTGSRTLWINPANDNYGFSRWAHDNKEELMTLGPGHHFGEWWGNKIQRAYGCKGGERYWSLFNTGRWYLPGRAHDERQAMLPACVGLVPVLYTGKFNSDIINRVLRDLRGDGSQAKPGYMNPEGIVIYHMASRVSYKITLERDESPKSGA